MKRFLRIFFDQLAASWISIKLYSVCSKLNSIFILWGSIAKGKALFPVSKNLALDMRASIKYPENIKMGNDVIVGANCSIGAMAQVIIGDLVRFSKNVTIETATLDFTTALPYKHIAKPITIGRGVWLSSGVTVLGGVSIGDYAIIGAGAVIAKDVEPYAVVVGSSIRKIRLLNKVE